MVVLRLGNLDNRERKFVVTKKEFLDKYLAKIDYYEEYILTQTFDEAYKYREYQDGNICKYTRNKKMGDVTHLR